LKKATNGNAELILTRNISKGATNREGRTFGCRNNNFIILKPKTPQNWPV